MAQCRFCEEYNGEMVKYGIRHYAHHHCYLKTRKPITDLHDWQIVSFPARLLKEFGLTGVATEAYQREKARREKRAKAA